jgi:hypothetical protein
MESSLNERKMKINFIGVQPKMKEGKRRKKLFLILNRMETKNSNLTLTVKNKI